MTFYNVFIVCNVVSFVLFILFIRIALEISSDEKSKPFRIIFYTLASVFAFFFFASLFMCLGGALFEATL